MKLIPDARRVALLAMSFWAQVLGLLVLIVPELVYDLTGRDTNPRFLWFAGLGLLLFGLVGRLVQQTRSAWAEGLRILAVAVVILLAAWAAAQASPAGSAAARPASQAETLAIAVPLVTRMEGVRLVAYRDPVGIPTICAGWTEGVVMGMRKTAEDCATILRTGLIDYRTRLHRYYRPETIALRLPATRDAAFLDLAWNCGVAAIGASTAVRRLNTGDIPGACRAVGWWNKARGRVLRGLVSRRAEDVGLCRVGL